MKKVEILGTNRFETYSKVREGSRGIIVQDGMILFTHEINSGWWLIPGRELPSYLSSPEYQRLKQSDF